MRSERVRTALRWLPRVRVLGPDHAGWDIARQIYNRMYDLHPAAIVQTLDPHAVAAVIDIARAADVPLAIRGGGHHIGGFGSCDGGVVIDFSPFRGVLVDRATGVVEVEPGARLRDVDRACRAHRRVLPLGTVSDTGIAGLALGGGIGWLVGAYGLTCDHLVGADVVLADGRRVRAEDDPDLLWALRGGGGNFGVVTRFRFQTRPLPSVTVGSCRVAPSDARGALTRLVAYLSTSCPRSITVAPTLGPLGLSVDFCAAGDPDLRELHEAVGAGVWIETTDADFVAWQSSFDSTFLPPMRGWWKSRYTRSLSEHDVDVLVSAELATTRSRRTVLLEHLHGAFTDTDESTLAFPLRSARFGVLVSARWPDAADDPENIAWVRDVHAALDAPDDAGSYSNYTAEDAVIYRGTVAARLSRVKAALDPHNVFRRNHNVRPRSDRRPAVDAALGT